MNIILISAADREEGAADSVAEAAAAERSSAAPPFSLTSIATLSGSMLHYIAGRSAHCSAHTSSESEASQQRSVRRVAIDEANLKEAL